ncbi:MAG: hypothetical protein JWL74_1701 [Alphaproteobacteria bacterium]|jgi:hypothetical protein|nr:hypothetical protein [Alphaproteobacteria bacterium]
MMRYASVPRVTAAGAVAALAALLLWVLYGRWPETFVLPYVAALVATAGCGSFILLATISDRVTNPRRGVRIRPIRGFDLAVGVLLAGPSLWALSPFLDAF